MANQRNGVRPGFSVIEVLAIAGILAIISVIIVPKVVVSNDTAKKRDHAHNKATINAAAERWYIEKGNWPADDLSDIAGDSAYFPRGLPSNPIDGGAYKLDPTTHRVD